MGPPNRLVVMSRFVSSSFPAGVRNPVAGDLARELARVVSEAIFDISGFVEAARHQRFDPLLRSGSADRTHARTPPVRDVILRRQPGVDAGRGVSARPFVNP